MNFKTPLAVIYSTGENLADGVKEDSSGLALDTEMIGAGPEAFWNGPEPSDFLRNWFPDVRNIVC